MDCRITVLPAGREIEAPAGANLLELLRSAGLAPSAPCGGAGRCGKCRVLVNGVEVSACRTAVEGDLTVTLPAAESDSILLDGLSHHGGFGGSGYVLALDIGTTTVAGYLLEGETGRELACGSRPNPQQSFGADVISRIRHALDGQMEALTASIRGCVSGLACSLCDDAGIDTAAISTVSVVGNPAMQQLFLGICPKNLVRIPFAPVLTKAEIVPAGDYLPPCGNARMLIVPDLSGYVGADTLACVLASKLDEVEDMTLLVDIGTNGEMVLGNRHRMVACSTAAGPALEGANISCGMRGQTGAIDHVWLESGQFQYSVIGGREAGGICGSGLIDAVAAALDAGLLNERGRILNEDRVIRLTDEIVLTQEDIRQVQMAKGAIAAGIELMAAHLGIGLEDIQTVLLAGAFGTFMDPDSACRMGLLPPMPGAQIRAIGNAAGSGAKILACDDTALEHTQRLVETIEFLELASLPRFQRCFAQSMRFTDSAAYWISQALALGFTEATPLEVATLQPRQDVRDMCAADKCRAYGKNWTCPPHCGSLADCEDRINHYAHGILLQTVGKLEKAIDTRAYRRTEQRHLQLFHALAARIRARHPDALCLGSGGCRICKACAYPEPCRFPDRACASMEGYGLFVTQVCRDNGLPYHHGEKTITYTACILFGKSTLDS